MKILSNDYISNTLKAPGISSGGPARFACELSQFLTGRGHEWIGLTNYVEEGAVASVKKLRRSGSRSFYNAAVDKKLVDAVMRARKSIDCEIVCEPVISSIEVFIKKTKPDVVFLNGYALFSWTLLCAARNCGIPVVMMHAGIWQKETEIYSNYFTQHGRSNALEMEKQISAYAVQEIFLNEFSWNYYNTHVVRVSKKQAMIIPLPCYPLSLSEKPVVGMNEFVHIGIVARWDRIKNHAAVLALAEEIKKKALPWKIYSVTRIPATKIHKQLKDRYKKLVTVVEPMSSTDLKAFIKSMDLMILPSVFDVSPGVVLEAAQMGKVTLISPHVGFVKEYKSCGLQLAVSSFEHAATVITKIKRLKNKSHKPELKKLLSSHKSETIFKQYEKVFADSVKKRI